MSPSEMSMPMEHPNSPWSNSSTNSTSPEDPEAKSKAQLCTSRITSWPLKHPWKEARDISCRCSTWIERRSYPIWNSQITSSSGDGLLKISWELLQLLLSIMSALPHPTRNKSKSSKDQEISKKDKSLDMLWDLTENGVLSLEFQPLMEVRPSMDISNSTSLKEESSNFSKVMPVPLEKC